MASSQRQQSIQLLEWVESEAKMQISKGEGDLGQANLTRHKKNFIIRKVTVAYGISEILRHLSNRTGGVSGEVAMDSHANKRCSIDNFAVRISWNGSTACTQAAEPSAQIEGVEMLSPAVSLQIIREPSFLSNNSLSQLPQDQMGRYLETEIVDTLPSGEPGLSQQISDENATLYSFGQFLYELFSSLEVSQVHGKINGGRGGTDSCEEPARKVRKGQHGFSDGVLHPQYISLEELGFPFSLSCLVQNLLDCQLHVADAYDTLHSVSSDLHLLLLEPDRFLFSDAQCDSNGKIQLQFRKEKDSNGYSEKLYGRETEVTQIQEAFCRVSSGLSEAFFIGGFSGSGKTRLVESLKGRIDVAGCYVVTLKFDAVSKERSLLEVVSAFNDLCRLIKEKKSPRDLISTANLLVQAFGAEISVLARLLPNLCLILPQLKKTDTNNFSNADRMNIQSVDFVLQRFMRVVSSASNPVMLFLDDLQWCEYEAMAVIEGILSDKEGSGFFFVGSYRSNEVEYGHCIYRFMDNLDQCNIPSTKLNLFGINYNDLNTMISDATGLFPRLCSSLADIVFQKTKGNPFFMLEFVRSLVDEGLLEYSICKKRWIWDEMAIQSKEITNNVLFLLANKMNNGLTKETISVLKVVSCFGIRIHESVINFLSATAEYSNIREGLAELVWESFMVKIAQNCRGSSYNNGWKFVHDKVQEAACSLIAEQDKDKYQKDLGHVLYSVCKGQKLGEALLPIVDRINHGLQSVLCAPAMCIDVAELNLEAGLKCLLRSDHSTANAYLNNALILLPNDSWKNHYNLNLQLSYLSAKTAYCLGNGKIAREAIRTIMREGHCTKDKLDAHFLLVVILNASDEAENAYCTCLETLTELGEGLEYLDGHNITDMVATTTKSLENKTEEDMMAIPSSANQTSVVLKFYSLAFFVAVFAKPEVVVPFCCRMVELTLRDGVSKHSALGLIQFAVHLVRSSSVEEITEASKIGKLALILLNKFDSHDILARVHFLYYGFVAVYTDSIQDCGIMLKRGFETAMSNGDIFYAFFSAQHHIRLALIGGSKLSKLLKQTEHYLTIIRQHEKLGNLVKRYLLIYRETITMLVDKSSEKESSEKDGNDSPVDKQISETINFHKALQSFWLGRPERFQHYMQKLKENECGRHHRLIATFYYGINAFSLLKGRRTSKLKLIPKACIRELKAAALHSEWNYRNKVHLMEAEMFSYEGNNESASSFYAAAILASRSSSFVHEQGLACELAGFHYKKIGNLRRACGFFNQAKVCYAEWGSDMKVDSITRQLTLLCDC